MSALSDYLESGLLHHIFRGQSFAMPSEIAIALTSGVPLDSNTGATIPEVPSGINNSLTGYSRLSLGNPSVSGITKWLYDSDDHAAGSGLIKNSSVFMFQTALQDWGWVSGIAILDNSTYGQGNVLLHSTLENPRIIYMGDTVKFDPSNLQVKLS